MPIRMHTITDANINSACPSPAVRRLLLVEGVLPSRASEHEARIMRQDASVWTAFGSEALSHEPNSSGAAAQWRNPNMGKRSCQALAQGIGHVAAFGVAAVCSTV